jgi:hypothetical protein
MWKLLITAAIAFVAGEMAVLAAVLVLGISRSRSTEGDPRVHPVHTGTPLSPDNPTGTPQGFERARLGSWAYPNGRTPPE